jgi:hypothetical protein
MATATRAKPGKAQAQFVKVPPNAARLVQALREMGYDSFASVLDIIDNSIDAKASKVWVTVKEVSKGSIVIDIQDDGIGMDRDTLAQALRLGSDVKHDVEVDLGKYGMGLVTASISMARCVWVLTRQDKAQAFEATFDLDTIERENDFVITLREADSRKVIDLLGDRGTLVRLSRIDRISDTNVARFAADLRREMGRVYRKFIDKGLVLTVNNRTVPKNDPLMREHELTEIMLDQNITLGQGKQAHLTVANLPELGTAGDEDAGILPRNSGFYIVRNGREIMSAQTFGFEGLAARHHSYSRFRAELEFDGTLDSDFHVDVKKSVIHPNDQIRTKIYERTKSLIAESGRRGRDNKEPVRLTPAAAEDRINAVLLARTLPKLGQGLPPVQPNLVQPTDGQVVTPAPKLEIIEEDKAKRQAPPAPQKAVEFVEEDAGDKGRFFSSEQKAGCPLLIKFNRQHPLLQMVQAKSKPATILAFISTAMARVEGEMKDGHKFVERVCSELTHLLKVEPAGPQPSTK